MPTLLSEPISPAVLARVDLLKTLPPAPAGFDPAGVWRGTWDLFSIHGYSDHSVGNAGTLSITHRPDSIQVDVHMRYLDHVHQRHHGTLTSRAGIFPAVEKYIIAVDTTVADAVVADRSGVYAGHCDTGEWHHRENKLSWQRPQTQPITCDWLLLARAATLDPQAMPVAFSVLDQACVRKPDHTARRRADLDQVLPDGCRLRCWTRIGTATFPVEYWLTEDGRVALVTAGNRWWALTALATGEKEA